MAQPLLNQVIAGEKGARSRQQDQITSVYQTFQKEPLFSGLTRVYTPLDENGESLPPEQQLVQNNVMSSIEDVTATMMALMDTVATKDWGNTTARADIVTEDGTVLIEQAPVTYMLFLEKQLGDLRTIISKLPTLDPAFRWSESDADQGVYETEPYTTNRTAKIPTNHVKAPATDKHPAQVETYMQDTVIGHYSTTKFSGAIPGATRTEMLRRVEAVVKAVKTARELANSEPVESRNGVSESMMNFILTGTV